MASKRRIRRKACGSKRKFATEQEARRQALLVKRKTGTQSYVMAYKCTFCHQWHWGNKYGGSIEGRSVRTSPEAGA